MDDRRFDDLARSLASAGATRRGVIGLIAGGAVALAGKFAGRAPAIAQDLGTPVAPPLESGQRPCQSDADCPGPPWACLGTGRGAYCFDTSSDATKCGPERINCTDTGRSCCSGVCIKLQDNPANCGRCGNACKEQETCCGSYCADLRSDYRSCGKCDNVCIVSGRSGACCAGICVDVAFDPKNCGGCGQVCKPDETCCTYGCRDLKTSAQYCGDCNTHCKDDEDCVDGKCRKRVSAAPPPQDFDLLAACVQPNDSELGEGWLIARSEWSDDFEGIESLDPELVELFDNVGGVEECAVVTLATLDDEGFATGVVKSAVVRMIDEDAARAVFDEYGDEAGEDQLLEGSEELFGDEVRVAQLDESGDPDFMVAMPDEPVLEAAYVEGAAVGFVWRSGDEPETLARLVSNLVERLENGETDGAGLAGRLVYIEGVQPALNIWYSRLEGVPQRRTGASDEQWERQQATEGDAIEFARANQIIPTVEAGTNYSLSTWAARFENERLAADWMEEVPDRLAAQTPDAQLIPVNEADGMGDSSLSFLYYVVREGSVTVGVTLYAQVNDTIVVTGLSAYAEQMTPALSGLFADARPLGASTKAVLAQQLTSFDANSGHPMTMDGDAVFGGNPLAIDVPSEEIAGQIEKTEFTACTPACNAPKVQDQNTPYQVWCQAAKACSDDKCTCNLFRTKKKSTTAEFYGKQNTKREYDPDNYTYSCSCGTTKET